MMICKASILLNRTFITSLLVLSLLVTYAINTSADQYILPANELDIFFGQIDRKVEVVNFWKVQSLYSNEFAVCCNYISFNGRSIVFKKHDLRFSDPSLSILSMFDQFYAINSKTRASVCSNCTHDVEYQLVEESKIILFMKKDIEDLAITGEKYYMALLDYINNEKIMGRDDHYLRYIEFHEHIIFDINDDGLLDIILGASLNYSHRDLYTFPILMIRYGGGDIAIYQGLLSKGYVSPLGICDLNEDGVLDLLIKRQVISEIAYGSTYYVISPKNDNTLLAKSLSYIDSGDYTDIVNTECSPEYCK